MVVTVNLGLSETRCPSFSLWFRKLDSLLFDGHVAGQSPTFRHTYIYMYVYMYIYMSYIVEGSLEVKLPTIWTDDSRDGKSQRREEEKKEKESEERRSRRAKG